MWRCGEIVVVGEEFTLSSGNESGFVCVFFRVVWVDLGLVVVDLGLVVVLDCWVAGSQWYC